MTLTTAEMNVPFDKWQSMKLKPGDVAQGFLANILVITGRVEVRQAMVEGQRHMIQVVINSYVLASSVSTVNADPGQYTNASLSQIASGVLGEVGVNWRNEVPDAEKPFPRVSEIPGETRFNFIERLTQMRNVFLRDDEHGTLIGFRGGPASDASLVEGRNIQSGRIVLRSDFSGTPFTVRGQQPGEQSNNAVGDLTRESSATVSTPGVTQYRPISILAPEPGDSDDLRRYANHEAAVSAYMTVDGEIVTPGWFTLDGKTLWIQLVTSVITIWSPSLFPENQMLLQIKGVVHSQDSQRDRKSVV